MSQTAVIDNIAKTAWTYAAEVWPACDSSIGKLFFFILTFSFSFHSFVSYFEDIIGYQVMLAPGLGDVTLQVYVTEAPRHHPCSSA